MAFPASGTFVQTHLKVVNATQLAYAPLADTVRVALFTNAIVAPDITADQGYNVAPWNANEVSGTGYTAAGVALASKTYTAASTVITFDAADTAWTSSTFSAVRGCLIYDDTLAGKNGIVAVSFGSDFAVTSGTFTIQWNASGIYTITG